jgi:hypothetical protein
MDNNLQDFTANELTEEEQIKKALEHQKYIGQHKNLSDEKVCQFKRDMIKKTLTIYFFGDTVINPSSQYPKEIIDKYYGHILRLTDEILRIQMEEPLFVLRESPQIVKEKNIVFNKYFKKALVNLNYDYSQIKIDIKMMFDTAKGLVSGESNNIVEDSYIPRAK